MTLGVLDVTRQTTSSYSRLPLRLLLLVGTVLVLRCAAAQQPPAHVVASVDGMDWWLPAWVTMTPDAGPSCSETRAG